MAAITPTSNLKGIPGPGEFKMRLYKFSATAADNTYDLSTDDMGITTVYGIRSHKSTDLDTEIANTVSGTTITFGGYSSGTETHFVLVWGV